MFWLVGNKWIWANENVLTKKGDGASVTKDDGRVVVRIKNKYITQKNGNLRSVPTMQTNSEGKKEALPVYLSFLYRCASAGTLKVCFENVDKTGFENFNSMDVEEELAVTDGYKQYTCNGLWNGTGDFKLSFTGDIYLYMLILSTDKIESLTYKYRTLFEQSEKLVKIAAQNFDQNGNVLAESGIMVKAEGTGIYAQGPDGKLALIGVGVEESYTDEQGQEQTRTVIKLTADNIKLEGLVTANQNFKIKEDGSIEAVNGKFTGEINASSGTIGGFDIGPKGIKTDDAGVLQIGGETLNTRFGITSESKSLLVQSGDNYPVMITSIFDYKENNRFTLRNTTNKKYDWLNIGIANLMDMDYFSSTSQREMPGRYGYQFAMLGTGHVALDGIVDGGSLSVISDWSGDNKVKMLNPPFESNRVFVKSGYNNSILALPDLYSVLSFFGYGISHNVMKKFSFRLDVMNGGEKSVYIAGRNTDKVNNVQHYIGSEMPRLFHDHVERTVLKGVEVVQKSMMSVMLVYDGSEYFAFTM